MHSRSQRDSGRGGALSSARAPRTANLGFPSIGAERELKWAIEAYWRGDSDALALATQAAALRERHWKLQQSLHIDDIPSNDFSLYDRMLDLAITVDAIPDRFRDTASNDLDLMFTMARGKNGVSALEITKWFDTNYHYAVPELAPRQRFRLRNTQARDAFLEAKNIGVHTRPVLIGPMTFCKLARFSGDDVYTLLPALLNVYAELLQGLQDAGADRVQIDEPALAYDLTHAEQRAFTQAYELLVQAAPKLSLELTTYFGELGSHAELLCTLPVAGIHLDCTRAVQDVDVVLERIGPHKTLSLGVVDGRNIWRNDLDASFAILDRAVQALGVERVTIAPSCSLLHVPYDLAREDALDPELHAELAFAKQKLEEIGVLKRAVAEGASAVASDFTTSRAVLQRRADSPRVHRADVAQATAAIRSADGDRSPFNERSERQAARLHLPLFPTTTIGSLPQTREVRAERAAFRAGRLSKAEYDARIRAYIAEAIRWQAHVGLDVFVHGEFERNDMVEFFGESLEGFAATGHGWVQSYGTRCVKPPIIFGDVARKGPMTVELAAYAQSLTEKPVKGMLTGPVTILNWSFVRIDQARSATANQIALALRAEVRDLEAAGIRVVQIDEPALREGLPLRRHLQAGYLAWAVGAFRLAAGAASAETQIHTHMCYAEFSHIAGAIEALDVDVVSIETARSGGRLDAALANAQFRTAIGPGVYDIHSPVIPSKDAIVASVRGMLDTLPAERIWINPDCGLKTRAWDEVRPAIKAMVDAARTVRKEIPALV